MNAFIKKNPSNFHRKRIEAPKPDEPPVTKTVKACIFEFNDKAIVFEFELAGEENLIGMVKPSDLVLDPKSGKKIPPGVRSVQALSKFIKAGDEIEAKVYKAAGLDSFKMTEDVDEIDSEGRETSSKREVVIDIEWTTTEAKILNSKKKDGLNKVQVLNSNSFSQTSIFSLIKA